MKSTFCSSGSRSGKYSLKLGASFDRVVKSRPVGVRWLCRIVPLDESC